MSKKVKLIMVVLSLIILPSFYTIDKLASHLRQNFEDIRGNLLIQNHLGQSYIHEFLDPNSSQENRSEIYYGLLQYAQYLYSDFTKEILSFSHSEEIGNYLLNDHSSYIGNFIDFLKSNKEELIRGDISNETMARLEDYKEYIDNQKISLIEFYDYHQKKNKLAIVFDILNPITKTKKYIKKIVIPKS